MYIHTYVYVCLYVYLYIYIYVYVCMYIYVYVYIYTYMYAQNPADAPCLDAKRGRSIGRVVRIQRCIYTHADEKLVHANEGVPSAPTEAHRIEGKKNELMSKI